MKLVTVTDSGLLLAPEKSLRETEREIDRKKLPLIRMLGRRQTHVPQKPTVKILLDQESS